MLNLRSVSTAKRNVRKPANAGQFRPTLLVTANSTDGELLSRYVKKGQWVVDGRTGQRGQFIGTKETKRLLRSPSIDIVMREYQPGRSFKDYQRSV